MLKSIRYGIRRYPTFIINHHNKLTGWDAGKLKQQIEAALESNNSAL
jgi:hypothetical protein